MKMLLFDGALAVKGNEDYVLVDAKEKSAFCRGCFGCWLKKPGQCVMADKLENIGSTIMQAEHVTIVSPCCYGGFSPNIKKVLDRCIPGVMPFFVTKLSASGKKEQHHSPRYKNQMSLSVWFYGDITDEEKQLAKQIVHANGLNYWAKEVKVSFVNCIGEVEL